MCKNISSLLYFKPAFKSTGNMQRTQLSKRARHGKDYGTLKLITLSPFEQVTESATREAEVTNSEGPGKHPEESELYLIVYGPIPDHYITKKVFILCVTWWEIDNKGTLHGKLLYQAEIKDERV